MPVAPIPVRRVPLLCGPPGNGGGVLRQYSMAMASQAARGRGHAGTRGAVAILPRGTTAQGIPLAATMAAGVERQLSGYPYGASAYGAGFPFGLVPSGGLEGHPTMPSGTRRLSGLGDSCDAARDQWLAKNGDAAATKYCSQGFKGSRGCDVNFASWCSHWGKAYGQPAATSDSETALYQTAISTLNTFIAQLAAGQIDPSTPAPGGADALGVNKNPGNAGIYKQYSDLVASISGARLQGQMMWALTHPTTSPSPTTSSGTTTVTPAASQPSGSYTDPNTGVIYYEAGSQNSWGMRAGVEPSPVNPAEIPGVDPIYGSGVDSGSPTQYVSAPGTAPKKAPPQPQKPQKKAGAGALAVGGLALIAIVAIGMKKRRKATA